jgi:hypothetical protein
MVMQWPQFIGLKVVIKPSHKRNPDRKFMIGFPLRPSRPLRRSCLSSMRKIVIATNNVGKLNEIGAILAPLDIEIVAQSTLGVPEAAEPHCTFVENALAKARHASNMTRR